MVMRVQVLRAGAQSGHKVGVTRQAPSPAVLSRQSLWAGPGPGSAPAGSDLSAISEWVQGC